MSKKSFLYCNLQQEQHEQDFLDTQYENMYVIPYSMKCQEQEEGVHFLQVLFILPVKRTAYVLLRYFFLRLIFKFFFN